MPGNIVSPTALLEQRQIGASVFAAGQNNQISSHQTVISPHIGQIDLWVLAQHIKVGVVADAGEHRHLDTQPNIVTLEALLNRNGVLGGGIQIGNPGQYAQHRFASALLKPIETGFQQSDITTKLVDHKTLDSVLLTGRQQLQRADQLGEHTATVDIGDQNHRAIHFFSEAHVGDVPITQIDFRRAACAFDHNKLIVLLQSLMRLQYRFHRRGFVVVVGHGFHIRNRFAVDNHLSTGIGIRFEQHRIHIHRRCLTRCFGLQGLGAPNLFAIGSHSAVQSHILGFERSHVQAPIGETAAQPGHQ